MLKGQLTRKIKIFVNIYSASCCSVSLNRMYVIAYVAKVHKNFPWHLRNAQNSGGDSCEGKCLGKFANIPLKGGGHQKAVPLNSFLHHLAEPTGMLSQLNLLQTGIHYCSHSKVLFRGGIDSPRTVAQGPKLKHL